MNDIVVSDNVLGDHSGHERLTRDTNLVGLAAVLLEWKKPLLVVPSLLIVLVTAITLAQPRTYTSTAGFIPQSTGASASRLAGIAAQFGFSVPQSDNTSSPAFYADLVHSRSLLEQLMLDSFSVSESGVVRERKLASLFEVESLDSLSRRDAILTKLNGAIQVSTTKETDVVRLAVTTRWRDVSQQVASRLLQQLNDFNLEIRQSQALAQGHFVENRLNEARADLRVAEEQLAAFLQRNHQFANDPQLSSEHDRLTRDIGMRQQLFTSLAQAYAQARFDALRDTPVIIVVDKPEQAARPDSRGLWYKIPLAGLVGVGLALFAAFIGISWRQANDRDPNSAARIRRFLHMNY